jgi:hypothetical protein
LRTTFQAIGDDLIAIERGIITNDDSLVRWVEFQDVERFGAGEAQPPALAEGVELDAFVVAQNLALQIDNLAPMRFNQLRLSQKPAVVVVRHEANLPFFFLSGQERVSVVAPCAVARGCTTMVERTPLFACHG